MTRRINSSLQTFTAAEISRVYSEDTRSIVEKYRLAVTPYFRIEISDQSETVLFSADSQIYENGYDLNGLIVADVEYDENDCQTSEMKLTVLNPDLSIHDSRLFAEGNSIDLWMGYDGCTPEYMGRGIIVDLEPTFEADNIPVLTVTAYDISYFMMEEGRAEIVPEGTAWFERNNQTTSSRPNTGATGSSTASPNQEPAARAADRSAPAPGGTTPTTAPPLEASPPPRSTTGTTPEAPTEPRTSAWRQWRPTRRGRDSGKVWREMRDYEIVEAIFHSYRIIPFTEATTERGVRAGTRTTTTERRVMAGTWHRDTNESRDRERARLAAESVDLAEVVPQETVQDNVDELDLEMEESYIRQEVTTTQVRQPTGGRRVVQKSGTTDWEFLKLLAKKYNYIVFVFYLLEARRWIGYWGPISHVPQNIKYNLHYANGDNTTLKNFRPKLSMRNQKTEIDLSYVDPRSGREQRVRVAMDSVSRYSPEFRGPDGGSTIEEPLGNGPDVVLLIHGRRTSVVANRNFTDPEDARRWLMSFWLRHSSDFCTAEGSVIIGLPEIHARRLHEISGVGRVSGNYFFTKVTHKMGSGKLYEVTFSCYRVTGAIFANDDQRILSVDDNALGERNPPRETRASVRSAS